MPDRFETLADIFRESTKNFADNELFGTKTAGTWKWTTYREFGSMVDRLRGGLAGIGVGRGDVVAIIADNRVEWAVCAYACFTLGAALVPMYEAQLDKDWEFIVKDCGAKVLVVAKNAIFDKTKKLLTVAPTLKHIVNLEATSGEGENVHTWKGLLEAGEKKPVEAITPDKKDTSCIIYTSGTTGNPKGVILSHNNIASNVSAVHEIFPISRDDRSLSFLPWAHSFGQTCELHALYSVGASMGLAESVSKILDNLAEVRPTLLFSVPRIFNRLYTAVQKQISEKPGVVQSLVRVALRAAKKQREGERVSFGEGLMLALANRLVFSRVRARFGGRLRYAFSGGAAISREVAEFIDGIGVLVYEGYGLTETSPITTANFKTSRKIGSVGKALPGVRVHIDTAQVDAKRPSAGSGAGEAGDESGTGGHAQGEIVVYGPNVMQGYHNRAEENAAVFTDDGGFRTGDMGYVDSEGFLYITGRIKEQYKLENGKYVVPTPLEEELKLSPYVTNVMVYGDNRPYNVALVVVNVEAVRSWAEKEGASVGTGDAILESPKVRELIAAEIEKYGEKFKGFESIQDFAMISADFTTDNGMLTPSLKLKRRAVMEKYGSLLDALYKKKKPSKQASSATA